MYFIIYGTQVDDVNHEYVAVAQQAAEHLAKIMVPGAYFIEFMPFLRYFPWIPGTKWKATVDESLPLVQGMVEKPFKHVKAAIVCCSLNSALGTR